MRIGCWIKLVLILTSVVAVLQVIHLVLLNRLEYLHQHRHRVLVTQKEPLLSVEEEVRELFRTLEESLRNDHILDSTGVYRIATNIPKGAKQPSYSLPAPDITLVTQCSYNHLNKLIDLVKRWQGPLSVAVYSEEYDVSAALWKIASVRACVQAVRDNVTFSLVSPIPAKSSPPVTAPPLAVSGSHADLCRDLDPPINNHHDHNYSAVKQFPNNLLRNVARRAATSEYVIVIDVDMMPNENLRQDFILFAIQRGLFRKPHRYDKSVFVVPAFEARDNVKLPQNKAQLLSLVETGEIRPFYSQLCWKCQVPTNYEAWQKEPPGAEMAPLFDVLWKDPWEPFYIASNNIPFYDERFKQYGFNRISQVCELHVAGYTFSVLNNAFLVHRGFKTASSFHQDKEKDQDHNRILFRQFKAELKVKYIDSTRRCY